MNIPISILIFANIFMARALSVWNGEKQRYITIKNEKIAKIFVDSQMFLSRRKNKHRNRMRIMGLVSYIGVLVSSLLTALFWAMSLPNYDYPMGYWLLIMTLFVFLTDIRNKEFREDRVAYVINIVLLIVLVIIIIVSGIVLITDIW